MIIADAHCDTLTKAVNTGQSLLENKLHWDIERAMQYDGFVQVLAIFQDPKEAKPTLKKAVHYARIAREYEDQTPFFKVCVNGKDIQEGLGEKKVCGMLSIEGGEALEEKSENLQILYNEGVRVMTLTWNHDNALGDGTNTSRHRGLTPFGRRTVRQMQEIGMLVDISHASEKTFWDCMEECVQPVIASHSNARAIFDHPRNLFDAQIRAVAQTGGMIGINFFSAFLSNDPKTGVDSLVRHIEHICGLAGTEAAGLGTDFDGMDRLPVPMGGVQHLDLLFNALARLNYPEQTLDQIAGGNLIRVLQSAFKE